MSTYPVGTIAVIRDNSTSDCSEWRAVKQDKGWLGLDEGMGWVEDYCVTDVRPLVVLDVKDPASLVEYLKEATDGFDKAAHGMDAWSGRAPIRDITRQIEAQVKPPRIPEPGLWGVVEAWVPGIPTRRWVHHEEGRWVSDMGVPFKEWDDLIDPVLVREGVES